VIFELPTRAENDLQGHRSFSKYVCQTIAVYYNKKLFTNQRFINVKKEQSTKHKCAKKTKDDVRLNTMKLLYNA